MAKAYTKAKKPALEIVLANHKVKSLVVNFCGAARCDVMAEGIITAWEEIHPTLPVFFSVHGTGDKEARQILKRRLGVTTCETMDQACNAAVIAAKQVKKVQDMIIRKNERVMIQGITGKQGTFWTERMQQYGTNIVGGIVPKRGGQNHLWRACL